MSVIPLTADGAYGPIDGTPTASAGPAVDVGPSTPAARAAVTPDVSDEPRPTVARFSVAGVVDDPTFWLVAALALAILLARFHATGGIL